MGISKKLKEMAKEKMKREKSGKDGDQHDRHTN